LQTSCIKLKKVWILETFLPHGPPPPTCPICPTYASMA
jgi:hypothetical protein